MTGATRATVRRLGSHWVLVATLLAVLAVGLLVANPFRGADAGLYTAHAPGARTEVPAALDDDRTAAVGRVGDRLDGMRPRPKHVALTFDDGPDPTWTPAVREVLARHGVKATFFVLGSQVVRHPEVVRELVAEGHQVGSHSFSHVDLGQAAPWRVRAELAATQLAVQGATGRSTALVRPPFSSTASAVDDAAWGAVRRLSDAGYVTVLSTADAKDWARPDAAALTREIASHGDAGQVVLMHDGGGDRAATVRELDRLLTELQGRGYTIGTVDATFGISTAGTVQGPARVLTAVALTGLWLCTAAVTGTSWLLLAAGGVAVLRALLLLWANVRHRRRLAQETAAAGVGPVTVVVPAYDEEAGIEATIRSIAASTHPVRVLVVDDGSTDDTAAIARATADALPDVDVRVVTQENAGKAAALNTGIGMTTTDLVVMVDGDTVFEPETITHLVQPFADARVGAVSGNAKVANRTGLLGRWQHIEYVIGFNMDRRLYDIAECMPTVPGAIGAFRTDALRAVGGLGTDTLAEDTDLTMALGRHGWLVRYAPEARAWTEAPASLSALWRQRYRWSYGTMQAMWKHRGGLLAPGAEGRYLRRSLTYMTLFQVLFPLMAPAVDLFALFGLFSLDPGHILAVWLLFLLVDLVIAVVAFRADRERLGPLWALPLTQVCYRQLMYLVVIHSLATAVYGRRLRWQRMERYGVHGSPGAPAGAATVTP